MTGGFTKMTKSDLNRIASAIVKKCEEDIETAKEQRSGHIVSIVCSILGIEKIGQDRKALSVFAKDMVAYQMRSEGFTLNYIGGVLGGYSHSTVEHMVKKMKDYLELPHIFKYEISMWNKFQIKLQQDETK